MVQSAKGTLRENKTKYGKTFFSYDATFSIKLDLKISLVRVRVDFLRSIDQFSRPRNVTRRSKHDLGWRKPKIVERGRHTHSVYKYIHRYNLGSSGNEKDSSVICQRCGGLRIT